MQKYPEAGLNDLNLLLKLMILKQDRCCLLFTQKYLDCKKVITIYIHTTTQQYTFTLAKSYTTSQPCLRRTEHNFNIKNTRRRPYIIPTNSAAQQAAEQVEITPSEFIIIYVSFCLCIYGSLAGDDGMAMMSSQRESQLAQTIQIERTHGHYDILCSRFNIILVQSSNDIYTFKGNETVIYLVTNITTIILNDNSHFDVCGHNIVIGIQLIRCVYK